MVYVEARGLDVTPKTIEKFRSGGDNQTGDLLEVILEVLIPLVHCCLQFNYNTCYSGWDHSCNSRLGMVYLFVRTLWPAKGVYFNLLLLFKVVYWSLWEQEPKKFFENTVRQNFRGLLKAPFNDKARLQAGMTPEWYLPLTLPVTPQ